MSHSPNYSKSNPRSSRPLSGSSDTPSVDYMRSSQSRSEDWELYVESTLRSLKDDYRSLKEEYRKHDEFRKTTSQQLASLIQLFKNADQTPSNRTTPASTPASLPTSDPRRPRSLPSSTSNPPSISISHLSRSSGPQSPPLASSSLDDPSPDRSPIDFAGPSPSFSRPASASSSTPASQRFVEDRCREVKEKAVGWIEKESAHRQSQQSKLSATLDEMQHKLDNVKAVFNSSVKTTDSLKQDFEKHKSGVADIQSRLALLEQSNTASSSSLPVLPPPEAPSSGSLQSAVSSATSKPVEELASMLKSLENRLDALDSRVSENSSKQFETKSSQAARLSSAEKRLDQCESILTDQAQSLRAVQEKPSPPPGVSEQFEVKLKNDVSDKLHALKQEIGEDIEVYGKTMLEHDLSLNGLAADKRKLEDRLQALEASTTQDHSKIIEQMDASAKSLRADLTTQLQQVQADTVDLKSLEALKARLAAHGERLDAVEVSAATIPSDADHDSPIAADVEKIQRRIEDLESGKCNAYASASVLDALSQGVKTLDSHVQTCVTKTDLKTDLAAIVRDLKREIHGRDGTITVEKLHTELNVLWMQVDDLKKRNGPKALTEVQLNRAVDAVRRSCDDMIRKSEQQTNDKIDKKIDKGAPSPSQDKQVVAMKTLGDSIDKLKDVTQPLMRIDLEQLYGTVDAHAGAITTLRDSQAKAARSLPLIEKRVKVLEDRQAKTSFPALERRIKTLEDHEDASIERRLAVLEQHVVETLPPMDSRIKSLEDREVLEDRQAKTIFPALERRIKTLEDHEDATIKGRLTVLEKHVVETLPTIDRQIKSLEDREVTSRALPSPPLATSTAHPSLSSRIQPRHSRSPEAASSSKDSAPPASASLHSRHASQIIILDSSDEDEEGDKPSHDPSLASNKASTKAVRKAPASSQDSAAHQANAPSKKRRRLQPPHPSHSQHSDEPLAKRLDQSATTTGPQKASRPGKRVNEAPIAGSTKGKEAKKLSLNERLSQKLPDHSVGVTDKQPTLDSTISEGDAIQTTSSPPAAPDRPRPRNESRFMLLNSKTKPLARDAANQPETGASTVTSRKSVSDESHEKSRRGFDADVAAEEAQTKVAWLEQRCSKLQLELSSNTWTEPERQSKQKALERLHDKLQRAILERSSADIVRLARERSPQ